MSQNTIIIEHTLRRVYTEDSGDTFGAETRELAKTLAVLFLQRHKVELSDPIFLRLKDVFEQWLRENFNPQADARQKSMGLSYINEGFDSFSRHVSVKFDEIKDSLRFVYAQSEADEGEGNGFWSNDHGWVSLVDATVFFADEDLNLPISSDGDARWVGLYEAKQLGSGMPLPFMPEHAVKRVADDISKLRDIDVYDLIDYAQDRAQMDELHDYIIKHRPDLGHEAAACLEDIVAERAPYRPSPKP